MKPSAVLVTFTSGALVAGFLAGVRSQAFPLGVRGEWEWQRVAFLPNGYDVALAAIGVVGYALLAGLVVRAMIARATPTREVIAVAGLWAASVAVQVVVQTGAPVGYGLAKWVLPLQQNGSNGYFSVARDRARDPWRFAAAYPEWVRGQDALHIGTHPPGLILTQSALLGAMERNPTTARFIMDHAPESVVTAFRVFGNLHPLAPAERATLVLTGLLTLLASASTVIPLYLLARATLPAPWAWATAALWPLVPAAVLFQPTADTAFPVLSTTAWALAAQAARGSRLRRTFCALMSGLVLGIGMQFSLVFLPVGLIVALLMFSQSDMPLRERLAVVGTVGIGFLGLTACMWGITRANPFVTWWWNQRNHARFYSEYPRSYLAWVAVNPIELAIALGLPVTTWALISARHPRQLPRVSLATVAVLAVLTLGGRSLSEVARLWIPFMPALLVAAGSGMGRLGAGPGVLAATIALLGAETLALEALIQVVYPV